MLYRTGTEPSKRELDLHIIQLEPYLGQIIKGNGYERDKKQIEDTDDLTAVVLCRSTFYSNCAI